MINLGPLFFVRRTKGSDKMAKDSLQDRVKDIVCAALRDNGAELVDMTHRKEGKRKVLRVLADKEAGITVEECARMNEIIGEALDKEDFMDEYYILEVSSPGLDRPLKTKADFLRIKGKRVRVHTYEPIDGRREFAGILEAVEDDSIGVYEENAKLIKMPLSKISKATFDYKSLI